MASIGYGYGSEWHLLQHLGRRRSAFTNLVEKRTGGEEIAWLDDEVSSDDETKRLKPREIVGLARKTRPARPGRSCGPNRATSTTGTRLAARRPEPGSSSRRRYTSAS
jgi:hypothetical protein